MKLMRFLPSLIPWSVCTLTLRLLIEVEVVWISQLFVDSLHSVSQPFDSVIRGIDLAEQVSGLDGLLDQLVAGPCLGRDR